MFSGRKQNSENLGIEIGFGIWQLGSGKQKPRTLLGGAALNYLLSHGAHMSRMWPFVGDSTASCKTNNSMLREKLL